MQIQTKMKELNLVFTVNEANLVLQALSNMPYMKVYELIGKIQAQAETQLGQNSGIAQNAEQDHKKN